MSFLDFLSRLPFPEAFSYVFLSIVVFLVGLGIYKFVKDWLPW